ncbi:uncharacterized protein FIBRA_00516 [Fibroporia radiculosa]|uniref:Fungal-type protein kinase domain-containing protein n=1 Tax=Fibroporia radiculosa TaxID=599839 RepID=J4HRR1_9APHY|nr:uncharacterized protein FIBRA_00516 [Fibroporia radiculosa]CCL98517.1 predicted protein [Fibroporia radiculosa]
MFYREGSRIIGVLCDWDLAKRDIEQGNLDDNDDDILTGISTSHSSMVSDTPRSHAPIPEEEKMRQNDAGDVTPQEDGKKARGVGGQDTTQGQIRQPTRYRTGTGQFMAHELLASERPPYHRYAHDLESFFFVLVYVCVVFNPTAHKFGHPKAWEHPDLMVIGENNLRFLTHYDTYEKTIATTHPDYKGLVDSWVRHFRGGMFFDVGQRNVKIRWLRNQRHQQVLNALDLKRPVKVDSLTTEIAAVLRSRRELVTYEKFMDLLNETSDYA